MRTSSHCSESATAIRCARVRSLVHRRRRDPRRRDPQPARGRRCRRSAGRRSGRRAFVAGSTPANPHSSSPASFKGSMTSRTGLANISRTQQPETNRTRNVDSAARTAVLAGICAFTVSTRDPSGAPENRGVPGSSPGLAMAGEALRVIDRGPVAPARSLGMRRRTPGRGAGRFFAVLTEPVAQNHSPHRTWSGGRTEGRADDSCRRKNRTISAEACGPRASV